MCTLLLIPIVVTSCLEPMETAPLHREPPPIDLIYLAWPIIAIKSTKIIIIEIQNSRNLLRNIQISIKDLSWNKNKRIYNHIIIYSFSHDYHSSWWSWQTTKINIIYFDKIKSLSNYSNYTETNNTTEIIKHREDTKHNLNKDTAKRMKQASSILLINEWRYKIIWLFLFLGIHHYFLLFAI